MAVSTLAPGKSFDERLRLLRESKLEQTREKQELIGSMNHDDWALVLPPPDRRKVVQTISPSGAPITDVLLEGFEVQPNHPSGGFFGPKAVGANYRKLLEVHPVYLDPNSSLAGGYFANFNSYRKPQWNPDLRCPELQADQSRYRLITGIGGAQHFCQDLAIGLEQGWGGILARIRAARAAHGPEKAGFYDGLEDVVLGFQDWIGRHAEAARRLASEESDPAIRANLEQIADINQRLVNDPPRTFREACQWILWFQMGARMYNGSGSLGRLDVLLLPFYESDRHEVGLTDEEATFHIACLLLRDTAYLQLGGPDEHGRDITNPVSFLVLEAAHRLRVPANVGVCVGEQVDPRLLRRGVEVLFADRTGIPKFLGIENTVEGFARCGYPRELGRQRAYSGCHWSAIPGREYTLNDCVKVNFGVVFDVALREMLADTTQPPSVDRLWEGFFGHLTRAVETLAKGFDFHYENMRHVFPELVMDLLCHGPIEKGEDASHGGVEFTNFCVDGSALATVADSFAALEQRLGREGRLSWETLLRLLDSDWGRGEGSDSLPLEEGDTPASFGERMRLMMKSIPRFGTGGALADDYATRIAQSFAIIVREKPTPGGHAMIPGIFSWASTLAMGADLGATPNGRHTGDPISHGASPDPGFRKDSAPTAMAIAVAAVQPGYGNTAPMQMDMDPSVSRDEEGIEKVADLIRTHFQLGGTQINLNVVNAQQILEAHEDPSKFPDLIVRVTGFSAYFSSLSKEFRQLVVDRILAE
ncbi:MAG TPA: pyruvate formate lyase family protein [Armatimonadota bacterium]|jgi:formate C-acetyltransferase